MSDSVIWRSEVADIMSACVGLAHVAGVYTDEARSVVEACATALGVELASPESWSVWHPGDDIQRSDVVHPFHTPQSHQSLLEGK